jgi:hypothetical protein
MVKSYIHDTYPIKAIVQQLPKWPNTLLCNIVIKNHFLAAVFYRMRRFISKLTYFELGSQKPLQGFESLEVNCFVMISTKISPLSVLSVDDDFKLVSR